MKWDLHPIRASLQGRRFGFVLAIVTVAGLVLSYNACGREMIFSTQTSEGGSGVGNPMQSKTLLRSVCRVIVRCEARLTQSDCESGVLESGGFGPQLGLPAGVYETFASILRAEESGSIQANLDSSRACSAAIESLECDDPLVQRAYDPTTQAPFSGVSFMIPTSAAGSCATVFAEPPGMADFYVSPAGNDNNDGSKLKPWATITHAARALSPGGKGATVHVASGTYTASAASCTGASGACGVHTARSGTASARIAFVAEAPGGARIVSDGASVVWFNSGDYVDIVGFEIVGDAASNVGLENSGSEVKIAGNQIHDIPVTSGCASGDAGGGIRHSNPSSRSNVTIANTIHDIGPRPGNGLPASSYCNHAHGISYGQPGGRILNNRIFKVATYGISTWMNATNLLIAHNLIFNSGAVDSGGGWIGGGITVGAGEADAGAVNDETVVANNIVRDNSGRAILEYGATGTGNSYQNNLLYANGADFSLQNGLTPQGTISSDPAMVNFQIDGSGDERLRAGSPAIDAGLASASSATDANGFMRPYGTGVDLGPSEWHP